MIKFIKKIDVMGSTFSVKWDKTTTAGSWSWINSEYVIGIEGIEKDPLYVMNTISHELMESILVMMGARYESGRETGKYLFSFDHQTFENAISIHAQALNQFLK